MPLDVLCNYCIESIYIKVKSSALDLKDVEGKERKEPWWRKGKW